ncbi:type II toxin-antitoxin system VapC family toxin [uncultured Rhodospira sp.]|uniref:type II toxin-antitoxin system VapC family toxin n=1 Tax=uncultured Rhodospira sp. TaxID=1936189 RepID=UPI0026239DF0|nr:type II toxin-antitoxin system VapC family toxin [uncultured Rhodospira sp.]
MILLDTNVVSEVMKPEPEPTVLAWLDSVPATSLSISSVTQAEILYGIALLPQGKRRLALADAAWTVFRVYFPGRIFPFDSEAAVAFADLAVGRRRSGHSVSQPDAQIAAIALSRNASLATRNTRDFVNCGVELIDPWTHHA